MEALNISRRQAAQWVVCLLVFAFLTRLCIGMLYYNTFDVNWYKTWALELQNGFFDCYSRMTDGKYALDYPPVYLIFLFIVGKLYGALPLADYRMFDMLAMKFFPILFDVLAAGMLYLLCRKKNEGMGILAAALWALNPSSIFNAACWGQTDGMMLCLLLLAFYMVDADRPILGSVLFAVTALTKMQVLYFVPVLFVVLLYRYKLKKALQGFLSALATGVAAFVPFIIGSAGARGWEALLTPFEVYFGGLGKYPYVALNTYNLYGIGCMNWVRDSKSILFGHPDAALGFDVGGFTYNHLSTLLMLAVLALTVFLLWRGVRENGLWLGCFVLMQGIFMLTTRMHERYQMAVLPFALVLYAYTGRGRWLGIFGALSGITFVNQFMLLIRNNTINDPAAPWKDWFNPVQAVFSVLNLAVFAFSVYEAWRLAFPDGLRKAPDAQTVPITEEVSP